MKFLEFLPFLPVDGTFEYQTQLDVSIGDVIACRFGGFDCIGVVLDSYTQKKTEFKLASASRIVFPKIFNEEAINFAKQLSKYYGYSTAAFLKLSFPFSIKDSFEVTKSFVFLNDGVDLNSSKSLKWAEIYNTLKHAGEVEESVFKGLSYFKTKGLISTKTVEVKQSTQNFQIDGITKAVLPQLSPEQKQVCDGITTNQFAASLVHGRTGSGKTEVYLHLIQQLILENREGQVVVLLPEIGLVKVISQRIEERFGIKVAVWHSGISDALRKERFLQVQNGVCSVIVGTRSALFLPYKNLKMIILDEEHDGSFKQDETPVYNARDAAVLLAKNKNIPIVLFSATPSVESFHNAKIGKYSLFNLHARFNDVLMPEVRVVNEKSKKFLSDTLKNEIIDYFHSGKQVLIFINRRGFSPINECSSCKAVFKCDSCDSLLTYHKKKGELICHKCSYSWQVRMGCPSCSCEDLAISSSGAGVEAIYEEVVEFLGEKNKKFVGIFSSDEQNSEKKLSNFIERVSSNDVRVIIGTQIASKGYDFANLKLVCIVDLILKNDEIDFKAEEKLMQLLVQVSGRGGRKGEQGLVLVQTKRNESDILRLMSLDQNPFYENEISTRKENFFPPFSRFITVTFSAKNEQALIMESSKLTDLIRRRVTCTILGPAPAPIAFIRNVFRYRVLIICKRSDSDVPKKMSEILKNAKCRTKIDVDAVSFY